MIKLSSVLSKGLKSLFSSRFSGLVLLAVFMGVGLGLITLSGGTSSHLAIVPNYGVANTSLEPFYVDPSSTTVNSTTSNIKQNTNVATINSTTEASSGSVLSAADKLKAMCQKTGSDKITVPFTPVCEDKVETNFKPSEATSVETQGNKAIPAYTYKLEFVSYGYVFAADKGKTFTTVGEPSVEDPVHVDLGNAFGRVGQYTNSPAGAAALKNAIGGIDRNRSKNVLGLQGATGIAKTESTIYSIYNPQGGLPVVGIDGYGAGPEGNGVNAAGGDGYGDFVAFGGVQQIANPVEVQTEFEKDLAIPSCKSVFQDKSTILVPVTKEQLAREVPVNDSVSGLLDTVVGKVREVGVWSECTACSENVGKCVSDQCDGGYYPQTATEDQKKEHNKCVKEWTSHYNGLDCTDKASAIFMVSQEGGSNTASESKYSSEVTGGFLQATRLNPNEVAQRTPEYLKSEKVTSVSPVVGYLTPCTLKRNGYQYIYLDPAKGSGCVQSTYLNLNYYQEQWTSAQIPADVLDPKEYTTKKLQEILKTNGKDFDIYCKSVGL